MQTRRVLKSTRKSGFASGPRHGGLQQDLSILGIESGGALIIYSEATALTCSLARHLERVRHAKCFPRTKLPPRQSLRLSFDLSIPWSRLFLVVVVVSLFLLSPLSEHCVSFSFRLATSKSSQKNPSASRGTPAKIRLLISHGPGKLLTTRMN